MKYRTFDRIKNSLEFLLFAGVHYVIEYSDIQNQFIKGNVDDVIFPITNYTLGRAIFCKKPNLFWALSISSIGTLAEIGQHYGYYPGTFDIIDIPMYFIGAGLAYGIDKLTFNEREANKKLP